MARTIFETTESIPAGTLVRRWDEDFLLHVTDSVSKVSRVFAYDDWALMQEVITMRINNPSRITIDNYDVWASGNWTDEVECLDPASPDHPGSANTPVAAVKKKDWVPKVIPDFCKFQHYIPEGQPFAAFYHHDGVGGAGKDMNEQSKTLLLKWFRSRAREWPHCNHGGTVNAELRFRWTSDRGDHAVLCFVCDKCGSR